MVVQTCAAIDVAHALSVLALSSRFDGPERPRITLAL